MSRTIYNKLIRDKIPEIIKADNKVPKISVLNDKGYKSALKKKLLEEVKELLKAKTRDDILNEIVDILQLIESLATNQGVSINKVEKLKEKKKRERGGFEKKLFLKYVDE